MNRQIRYEYPGPGTLPCSKLTYHAVGLVFPPNSSLALSFMFVTEKDILSTRRCRILLRILLASSFPVIVKERETRMKGDSQHPRATGREHHHIRKRHPKRDSNPRPSCAIGLRPQTTVPLMTASQLNFNVNVQLILLYSVGIAQSV
jgi:hypothetical protein